MSDIEYKNFDNILSDVFNCYHKDLLDKYISDNTVEIENHKFSDEFDSKINSLLNQMTPQKKKRKISKKIVISMISVAVVATLTIGTATAYETGLFEKIFDNHTQIEADTAPAPDNFDTVYTLTDLNGFEKSEVNNYDSYIETIYEKDTCQIVLCQWLKDGYCISVDNETSQLVDVDIDNITGKYMDFGSDDFLCFEKDGYVFEIWTYEDENNSFSKDDLIKIAKSLKAE